MSKADYQAAITDIVEDSTEPTVLYNDLVVRPRPREECLRILETFEDEVGDLVGRVAELRPPAPVQEIHDDLVSAAERSVERIGTVRAEVATGEVSCGDELNDELYYGMPSREDGDRAIARLERRGYLVLGQ